MRYKSFRKAGACVLASALAVTMVVPGFASAETNDSFWTAPTEATTIDNNLLKTYGVRAGSAGGDFVGVTNTNFDFTSGKASQQTQYSNYTADQLNGVTGAGLALWATSVNESANPYYANLVYNKINNGTAPAATTWMSNPGTSAWGDSNGESSTISGTSTQTIAGLEYQPDIIFGANKTSNWDANGTDAALDVSSTNIGKAVANGTTGYSDYNPTFVNNDSTNLWTQIYTINNLAQAADKLAVNGKKTRYNDNSAITGALAYEKALRGNLLWIASQIDQGKAQKKTVAYLYAIDANDTGYFFIPEASGLASGNDTGKTSSSAATTADSEYAGNNGTIDLDYMDTLPFITNTFKNGTTVQGGIVMKVEDIYKTNPAVSVGNSQTSALNGVDAIIFNTNTDLVGDAATGTSNGKNESGVSNKETLTKTNVEAWAKEHGFTGSQIIAGDDWGTSTKQGYGTTETTADGMSPLLYCQRNYTTDKPARAAWAFSQLYPELYPNADASYAYWVKNVYHINMADVPKVVKYFTNQSDDVSYDATINQTLEDHYQAGLNWWANTGSKKTVWNQYAYYTGSSRASYYGGDASTEEPASTIGIFAPSKAWAKMAKTTTTKTAKKAQSLKVSVSKKTVKAKTLKKKKQTVKIKVKKAKGSVTYKKAKSSGKYKKASISKKSKKGATITFKKGAKKGTYKFKVKAKTTKTYKASKTYTVTVKVK